jgi:hypothetical protein
VEIKFETYHKKKEGDADMGQKFDLVMAGDKAGPRRAYQDAGGQQRDD